MLLLISVTVGTPIVIYTGVDGCLGGELKATEASVDRVMKFQGPKKRFATRRTPLYSSSPARSGARITIKDVTLGYEAGRSVLRSTNLRFRPAEKIALVGRTGAGKNTLTPLISRFFDSWEGRILFDGRDVKMITSSSLDA